MLFGAKWRPCLQLRKTPLCELRDQNDGILREILIYPLLLWLGCRGENSDRSACTSAL